MKHYTVIITNDNGSCVSLALAEAVSGSAKGHLRRFDGKHDKAILTVLPSMADRLESLLRQHPTVISWSKDK